MKINLEVYAGLWYVPRTSQAREMLLSAKGPSPLLRFASFEMDFDRRELRRHGYKIKLQDIPFQVLTILLERPGELVTREELQKNLWAENTFVDFDHNLNNAINKLRAALNDSSERPRFIETIPRWGYRFIAPIEIAQKGGGHLPTTYQPSDGTRSSSDSGTSFVPTAREATVQRTNSMRRGLGNSFLVRIASVFLLIVSGVLVWRFFPRLGPANGRVMLVVLPFENFTGDANQDYLCDGMTEELIARLGNVDPDHLGVIARTTSMHYKGSSKTVKEIGGELRVDYVLESSLGRFGDRFRLTTQLIQVREQRHLWARSFDWTSSNAVGLQTEVSTAVANEIPLHVNARREIHPRTIGSADAEAYLDYLRGRFFWNKRNREGLNKGIFYFAKAIQEDPHFARAYAGLADCYLVLGGGYLSAHEAYKRGRTAAAKALELDGDLAEAHTSMAYFNFIDQWDWPGADLEFSRAIALDPGYATAHHWYAIYLSAMKRMPEAIREIQKAVELDPLSTVINSNVGAIYQQAGDYEKSRKQLLKTLELDANFVAAYGYLGYLYQANGQYEEALAVYKKAQQVGGDPLFFAGDVGRIYVLMGRKSEARALLKYVLEVSNRQPEFPAFTLCLLNASLGDNDAAFHWLSKSIEDREFTATELSHDFRISNLRADPRFVEISRQFHLPDSHLH